jgi:hypothetical protein
MTVTERVIGTILIALIAWSLWEPQKDPRREHDRRTILLLFAAIGLFMLIIRLVKALYGL